MGISQNRGPQTSETPYRQTEAHQLTKGKLNLFKLRTKSHEAAYKAHRGRGKQSVFWPFLGVGVTLCVRCLTKCPAPLQYSTCGLSWLPEGTLFIVGIILKT